MALIGTWKLVEPFSEMDKFLETVGVTDANMKAMIMSVKPEVHISESGGQWELKMVTPQNTRVTTFTNGQEIDSVSIIGRPVKSVLNVDGNQIHETHTDPQGASPLTTINRLVDGDNMTVTLAVNGVKSVGKYQRA